MTATCRCGAAWGGLRTAHCAICHETFGGVGTFDKHKPGQCRDPQDCGMVVLRVSGTSPIWGYPNTGEKWWKNQGDDDGPMCS